MKKVLITLLLTAFAYTGAQAQTKCETAAKAKSTKTVKHKTTTRTPAINTTTTTLACRMLPYQVCTINEDRRSVTCYYTTDTDQQVHTGPPTVYGPTGPMPGEAVHFKVRTVVVKGKDKGAFCKRNKEGNATICTQPGLLIRDENGYYSYGEATPKYAAKRITAK